MVAGETFSHALMTNLIYDFGAVGLELGLADHSPYRGRHRRGGRQHQRVNQFASRWLIR